MRYQNVTSYSQLSLLHACPREYQLSMHRAMEEGAREITIPNLDFCFGHAVGAGAQNWLLTKDLDIAGFNACMSWRADLSDRKDKAKKSLWEALIAVDKFADWWAIIGDEWDLLILPNGKPAIELAFSLHARNNFKHYGHIDIVLTNKYTGRMAVLELKTTGMGLEEALYANSNQATGYSIMLDAIFPGITEYEVLYAVYLVRDREWHMMPFSKTALQKAEVIKDMLLDHSVLDTYETIGFYPKRGESCFRFNRRCKFFGECNLVPSDPLPKLEAEREAEAVDYVVDLEQVIRSQQGEA